jgi:hypothetical protein
LAREVSTIPAAAIVLAHLYSSNHLNDCASMASIVFPQSGSNATNILMPRYDSDSSNILMAVLAVMKISFVNTSLVVVGIDALELRRSKNIDQC